jgi:hypothetical protein
LRRIGVLMGVDENDPDLNRAVNRNVQTLLVGVNYRF